jgi:integrase
MRSGAGPGGSGLHTPVISDFHAKSPPTAREHLEIVARNVAGMVRPPKVDAEEVEILTAAEVGDVLTKLTGHRLFSIAVLALGTGLRRGEMCELRWRDVDMDGGVLRVERAVEQTRAGLKVKAPKTRHGRRTIALPGSVIDALRTLWLGQLKTRFALGLGRPGADDLLFTLPDGSRWGPDYLSRLWRLAMIALGLPRVGLHSLRHAHASALISAGVDVLTISRRLGHATPAFTLAVCGHLFANTDAAAANAIDVALGAKSPV